MHAKTVLPLEYIALLYAEGLSPAKINEILGKPVHEATIKRRLQQLGVFTSYAHRAHHIELTTSHNEMLAGLLLGDGSMGRQLGDTSAWVTIQQACRANGTDGRPWVREIHQKLSDSGLCCSPLNEEKRNSYGPVLSAQTLSYTELIPFYYTWYKQWTEPGEFFSKLYKRVPENLKLTPLTLAWWFCGDGSGTNHGGMEFATDGFCVEDVELLRCKLENLGFTTSVAQHKRKATKPWTSNMMIRLGVDDAFRLGQIILPHIPQCFHYKLARIHRPVGKGFGHVPKTYLIS